MIFKVPPHEYEIGPKKEKKQIGTFQNKANITCQNDIINNSRGFTGFLTLVFALRITALGQMKLLPFLHDGRGLFHLEINSVYDKV